MTKSGKASRAIRAATHESQVLLAVREYLESLSAAEAAALPAELLVMSLGPAEELVQSALQALHGAIDALDEKPRSGVLKESVIVFTAAARRLAAIAKDTA